MSDQSEAGTLPIRFLGQYIRDLSFEVPHAPDIFSELRQAQPAIPVQIEPTFRHLKGSQFEVSLTTQVSATVNSKPAFVLELVYCAVVEIDEKALAQEHLHPVLGIEVPRFLFPFARQIVNDQTVSGGFPPLVLQPVDFVELYRRKYGDKPQQVQRSGA